jgi:O-methyltransferase involved in polyketide biosynthesis
MTADLDRVSSGAVAVRSSRTAETNALERAAEALHPAAGRLLDDPYAHLFVRRPLYRALLRLRPVALRALHRVDERYPGLHAEIMLRARYVDGLVEAANFEQLVLLGAGYDATAFRHQLGTSVRVFEVDSPQTQGAKRAGEAFTATLRDVASFAPSGARMILDYMDPDVIDGTTTKVGARRAAEWVAKRGEPYRLGFTLEQLTRELDLAGFGLVEHLRTAELAQRFRPPAGVWCRTDDWMGVALAERR